MRRPTIAAAAAALVALLTAPAAPAQLPDLPPVEPLPPAGEIGELVDGVLDDAGALPGVAERLRFTWETAWQPQDGGEPVRRTADAALLVPTLLDVDASPGPDVVAQLQIDAGRATVRVTKLPAAAERLPLAIEAVLPDPRGGGELHAAFGYDTLDATAPEAYDATLALVGSERASTFTLDTRTAGPGERLAVTGSVFERGEGGERVDPVRARIGLDPVPAVFHVGVLAGEDLGLTRSGVEFATETPTRASVVAEDVRGGAERRLEGTIESVPNTLSLALTDAESGERTLSYTASERVERIDARLADRRGEQLERDMRLALEDMPTSVQLVQDSRTHLRMEATDPIGALEFASATGGAARTLDEPAYAYAYDRDGVSSIAARVLGLRRAEVSTADPFVVDATLRPGPFRVLVEDGERRIDGAIRDLPGEVRVELSPANGTLSYRGSDPIGEVRVEGSDPAGLSGRATRLDLRASDVPTALDLAYAEQGGRVAIDAGDATVGQLEVQLTSGPDERLPADVDGVLLHDLADRYVVFGRVTGLRRVAVTQSPAPDLELDATGGRVFSVDYRGRRDDGQVQTVGARVDRLQPRTRVRYVDDAQGQRLEYSADGGVDEISLDATNLEALSGRARDLHLLLREVPQTLTLGFAQGGDTVDIDTGGQTLGLLEAQFTSGPDRRLASTVDGILLEDLADRYVLFARVTGLRRVRAVQQPAPDLTLETSGGRVFEVDLNRRLSSSKVEFTRATLDRLVPSVRVRVVPTSAGQRIEYAGSQATNRLAFATNAGERWRLDASLAPLPTSFVLCQASNSSCGGSGRMSNAGSVSFNASAHTVVNMLDCVRPATSACPGDPDEFIRVTNLRVRRLVEDAHSENSGERGHIYLDTDNHELTGSVLARDGSGGFEATFPSGFRSNDRLGRWTLFGLSRTKTGSITCPGGTSLAVYVLGLRIGVTSYLC